METELMLLRQESFALNTEPWLQEQLHRW